MSTILIPQEYLMDFEVSDIKEKPPEWIYAANNPIGSLISI
jgi:hypothetical protein